MSRVLDVLRSAGVGLLGIGTAVALMAGMWYGLRLGILRMVLGIPAICGLAAGYMVGLIDQWHPVLTAAVAGAVGLGAVLATPNRGGMQGQLRSIAALGVGVATCAGVLGAVWAARTAHPWWGAGAILSAIVLLFVIPHISRIVGVHSFTSQRLGDVRATVAQRLVAIPATDVNWRHHAMPGPRGALGMFAEWTGETELAGQGECSADIDTYGTPRMGPLEGVVRSISFFFEPESPADVQSREEALSLLEELAVVAPPRDLREQCSELGGVSRWWSTRRDPLEKFSELDGVPRSRSTGCEETNTSIEIDVYPDGRVDASYYSWPTESDEDLDDPFDFSDESFGSGLRKVWRWCARLGW